MENLAKKQIDQELEAFYGLPKEVKFCKKCVISNQRPSSVVEFKNKDNQKRAIELGKDGICEACHYNEIKQKINWKEREEMLFEILEPFRKTDGSYDVIVPSSGGKDSSFTAHVLKYKYGMNPLTVTWAPHLYTNVGWNNQNNLAHVGGIDNILYTPNGKLHRVLTQLAFKNLGHPFQPFIHGQKIVGPLMAEKFDVPLIFYGENQAEYGNNIKENYNPTMNYDFFTIDNPKEMLLGGMKVSDIMNEYNFTYNDFTPYIPRDVEALKKKDIKVYYLGFFERWDPQECYYYAVENSGFQAAPERSNGTYSKYTEIDDKLVPFHFYTMFIKFGIGRATYDAAQEIRNQKITREEGVALVNRYDHEFPNQFYHEFLEYMGLTDEEFHKRIDELRSPHLWAKVNGEWKMRHNVARTGIDDIPESE